MYNLSLPIILKNNTLLNNNFYNCLILNNEYKDQNINIKSLYGSFPFCTLNGNVNLNQRKNNFYTRNDLYTFFSSIKIPIRLDCSNIYISTIDLSNNYNNLILELGNQGNNFLEVSNLEVFKILKDKYKNYKFILSNNIFFIDNTFNIDMLNEIIKTNNFSLYQLPTNLLLDKKILQNIEQKDKIEILISRKCLCNKFNNIKKCNIEEQKYINNFCESSGYNINCNQLNLYQNANEIINECYYYSTLGFSNFKVDMPLNSFENNFYYYLINNLISDNTKLQFLQEINKNHVITN